MHFSVLLSLIPIVNILISVKVHRESIYNPQSSCAFIGNRSFSNDASIQSCIWECVHEYDCQTAVYYKNEKICSMFNEICHKDHIQTLSNGRSSVICYQKNHNPISTCPLATTLVQEEPTTSHMMMPTTLILLTDTNETIFGIFNTTAGGSSSSATSIQQYHSSESPENVFDRNVNTKYYNYGLSSLPNSSTGINSGFYFTVKRGSSLLIAVQFCTANDHPDRDPLTMTIEGTNHISTLLTDGSSWTLIYNGTTGLENTTQRYTNGTNIRLSNRFVWYLSYRLLITSKRGIDDGVQYSEVYLYTQ